MPDLSEMSRVLYCHQWQAPEHWADALCRLAELSDAEITELERLGRNRRCACAAADGS